MLSFKWGMRNVKDKFTQKGTFCHHLLTLMLFHLKKIVNLQKTDQDILMKSEISVLPLSPCSYQFDASKTLLN